MASFMNPQHFAKLREAQRNGDESAIAILTKYRDGADFSDDLDNYFNPKKPSSEPAMAISGMPDKPLSGLELFLSQNGVSKDDPDYEDTVNEFYSELGMKRPETPQEEPQEPEEPMCFCGVVESLIADENEAVQGYDKAILFVMNDPEMKPDQKELLVQKLQHIKDEELEHIKELQEMSKK